MSYFDDRYIFQDDRDDLSASTTNVTQSDLPGAGRTLGNLYGNLGTKLETVLISLANKIGKKPTSAHRDNANTLSVISPNETQSDLPGAGRTLGRVYGRLGVSLEEVSNYLANKNGMGPIAVAQKVRHREWDRIGGTNIPEREYTWWEVRQQRRDVKKLINYAKYV